jgi:DNA polymerase V
MLLSSPSQNESGTREVTKVSHVFRPQIKETHPRPLYTSRIAAGLPATVEDHSDEEGLDLNEHLLKNPTSTFFVRVSGDSMIDAGIHPGDLLVVDRSIPATNGRIIVAVVNGESTVKRLIRERGRLYLMPENSTYSSIEIKDETTFMVWGVVTNVIHAL